MPFVYIKAIHIIGVVSWFAGLFYLVRLFVYHSESFTQEKTSRTILHTQYSLMEKRLAAIIATPSMIITLVTGGGMLTVNPSFLDQGWMHAKLALIVLLVIYHIICIRLMNKFVAGEQPMSSVQLRLWNEVATLLLVAIVFLVVVKTALSMFWGVAGLVILGVVMMIAVKMYKKSRESK